jgi:hypothetical protein
MKKGSTKLTPLLRMIAAFMLLLWLAAVSACSTECLGDDCHPVSALRGQSANVATGPTHDAHKKDCHDDSLCDSLHSICPATPSQTLIKPHFGMVFALDFTAAGQLVVPTPRETNVFRQMPEASRSFTPEVCLGPAFRSLAPPVLA